MAKDRIELVRTFLERLGRLEIDAVGDLLAEDAVMTFPFIDQIEDVVGRDAIIAQIAGTMPAMLEAMNFTFDAWYETADPDCLIVEYRSRCPLRGREGSYANDYIAVFRFRDDRITLYKEYLNPVKMAAVYSEEDMRAG